MEDNPPAPRGLESPRNVILYYDVTSSDMTISLPSDIEFDQLEIFYMGFASGINYGCLFRSSTVDEHPNKFNSIGNIVIDDSLVFNLTVDVLKTYQEVHGGYNTHIENVYGGQLYIGNGEYNYYDISELENELQYKAPIWKSFGQYGGNDNLNEMYSESSTLYHTQPFNKIVNVSLDAESLEEDNNYYGLSSAFDAKNNIKKTIDLNKTEIPSITPCNIK
jgi:hypothetical protein